MPKTNIKYPRRSKRLHSQQVHSSPRTSDGNISANEPSLFSTILPGDIIGRILFGGYLDKTPQQAAVIRGVCSQFSSLTSTFCTTLDFKPSFQCIKKKAFGTRIISNLIKIFPSVTELDFSHLGDAFNDRHIRALVPLRRQLRTLKLKGTGVSSDGVMSFFGITNSNKKCDTVPLEHLDLSKTLLKDRNKISDVAIFAVGACCKNLKSLQLSMCHRVDDEVLALIASKLKSLQELNLSMCNITTRGCCHLACLPNLRVVDISSALGVSGQAIRSMITGSYPSGYKDSTCELFDDEESVSNLDDEVSVFISEYSGEKRESISNLRVIVAQFATSGFNEQLFETLAAKAPRLNYLDVRNYMGNDISKGIASPLKRSIRKLERNGANIIFSRAKGFY